jgi:putative ABC transport system ATP-binding protein
VADEPTVNQDALSVVAAIQLISGMVREGVTVLVVTHEERVSAAATQVLHLEGGRLR